METRPANIKDFAKQLKVNLPKALIYLFLVGFLPFVSLFLYPKLIAGVSTFYQIIGIYLLYFEEKNKMNHHDRSYGKLNTWLMFILKSWSTCKRAVREIYRLKTNFYKKDCDLKVNVTVTAINHDYKDIEDPNERMKQQLISIESDLSYLRYFSEVRKTGYILIAIGYILQFLISFCSMFSLCFCPS